MRAQWDGDGLATEEGNKQVRGNSPGRPRGEAGRERREEVGELGALQGEPCGDGRGVGQSQAARVSAEDCSGVGVAEQYTQGLAVFA